MFDHYLPMDIFKEIDTWREEKLIPEKYLKTDMPKKKGAIFLGFS